jgi:hypothetical protein
MDTMTGVAYDKKESAVTLAEKKAELGGGTLSKAPMTVEEEKTFHDLLGASQFHKPEWTMIDCGSRGSRKKHFVPILNSILDSGWKPDGSLKPKTTAAVAKPAPEPMPAESVPGVARGCACNLNPDLLCQTHSEYVSPSRPSTLPAHFTCTEVDPGSHEGNDKDMFGPGISAKTWKDASASAP